MFNSTVLAHPHVYYLICGSTVHGWDQQRQHNNSLQHQGKVAPQVSHSKREGERDGHVTRRERNEFIFLQSVVAWPGGACRHGFQDEGQHNGQCMVGTVGLGLAPPSTLGESET